MDPWEHMGPNVVVDCMPLPFKARAPHYRDGIRVVVPSVRRTFVPIDCPRLRSLDTETTRVPADRLALLQSYFCDPGLVHVHH